MTVRLAVPDLVSPSYFPALAAVELGFFARHGLNVDLTLRFPVTDAADELRAGEWDLLAGAAHAPCYAPNGWTDLKLLAALSRHTYWFLVVRANATVTGITELRDVRIGVAPGPDLALRVLLHDLGIDTAAAGIELLPVPGGVEVGPESVPSFGVTAAEALVDGTIDAFWANGMGARVAVESGHGRVLLDARRTDGPHRDLTFAALMTSTRWIAADVDRARRAVRAVVETQRALRDDPELAARVGTSLFPPYEAGLISSLVADDAGFYDPAISGSTLRGLASFAVRGGLSGSGDSFDNAIASEVVQEWMA